VANTLLMLALLCVAWGIVSWIRIVSYLSDRGVKINYFLMKLMFFRYMKQYSEMTEEEEGRPGFWFYSYIVSMNLTLVFAVAGLILRSR